MNTVYQININASVYPCECLVLHPDILDMVDVLNAARDENTHFAQAVIRGYGTVIRTIETDMAQIDTVRMWGMSYITIGYYLTYPPKEF